MSNFGSYSGKQLLDLKLKKREWLVDNIMKMKDSVILVGDAKAGKSLLKQQLCCSLTSTHPFIDKFKVNKQCKVTDIQLEGELEDTQDRFQRMTETLDFEPEHYHLIFEAPIELNTLRATKELIHKIERHHNPDVIFIDPVYFAFRGSLSEDMPVRNFLGNLRIIKEHFDCSIVLVHHTHKIRINYKTGEIIDEGDEAMFGSKFFSAWPDHILLFIYDKKNNLRVLTCTTQRSGQIADKTMLNLVQPSPLYFEEINEQSTREDVVIHWLRQVQEGLTVDDLTEQTKLSRNTIYLSLKKLLKSKLIVKSGSRPILYCIKGKNQ